VFAGQVFHAALLVFIAFLWVRFVFDWVQVFARTWSPKGPMLLVLEAVYSVTDPPIRALRRLIPPLRLGPVALDLSFLVVLIGAYVLLGLSDAAFGL
jgi:YggT family protein